MRSPEKIIFSSKSTGRMEQTFENHSLNACVRTLKNNDEILFYAKDVAKALGYKTPKKAVWDHVWEENKCTVKKLPKVPKRNRF